MAKECRKKTKYITEFERNLLSELYREERKILNNVRKTSETLTKKKEAWARITAKLNATEGVTTQRTVAQVTRLWENIITRFKRDYKASKGHFTGSYCDDIDWSELYQLVSPNIKARRSSNENIFIDCETIRAHLENGAPDIMKQEIHEVEEDELGLGEEEIPANTSESGGSCHFYLTGTQEIPEKGNNVSLSDQKQMMEWRRIEHEHLVKKLHFEKLYYREKYKLTVKKRQALEANLSTNGCGASQYNDKPNNHQKML